MEFATTHVISLIWRLNLGTNSTEEPQELIQDGTAPNAQQRRTEERDGSVYRAVERQSWTLQRAEMPF